MCVCDAYDFQYVYNVKTYYLNQSEWFHLQHWTTYQRDGSSSYVCSPTSTCRIWFLGPQCSRGGPDGRRTYDVLASILEKKHEKLGICCWKLVSCQVKIALHCFFTPPKYPHLLNHDFQFNLTQHSRVLQQQTPHLHHARSAVHDVVAPGAMPIAWDQGKLRCVMYKESGHFHHNLCSSTGTSITDPK